MTESKPCRLCALPLTGERVRLGYTGCFECEQLHLMGQLAGALGRPDKMPAWWIDETTWLHWDNSQGVREGLQQPIPYGDT